MFFSDLFRFRRKGKCYQISFDCEIFQVFYFTRNEYKIANPLSRNKWSHMRINEKITKGANWFRVQNATNDFICNKIIGFEVFCSFFSFLLMIRWNFGFCCCALTNYNNCHVLFVKFSLILFSHSQWNYCYFE